MKNFLNLFFLASTLLCQIPWLHANTIKVPQDSTTIQAALNGSENGDTVLVAPGTYSGPGNFNLNFQGKAILLVSQAGAEQTIIDVTGADFSSSYGIRFTSQETRETIVRGFTITGAERAGINCSTNTQPLIEDCILEQNSGTSTNGINLSSAAALIRNCIIRNNGGFNANGGGINANNSPNTIIQNCLIVGNQGRIAGAIYSSFDSPQIINCTIIQNQGAEKAGGVYATRLLNMRNSIVWNNTSPEGLPSIFAETYQVTYSNLENKWPDLGNLNEEPIFLDTLFHLDPSSSDVDAGNPFDAFDLEPSPNGERINMGWFGNTSEAALGIDGEPIIDSLAIGVGPIQGGITDTITGKKFGTNVGTLTVGGQPATIQSWSDTQIICTIPAHPAGKVGVKITTADAKMETLTYGFIYEGSLSIKVPVDYPTIQEALNVAINGDTVLVAPGTYSGPGNFNLNFQGKAILLVSQAGAEQTIIDVTGADFSSSYGIRFTSQETRETIVRGFTITGAERAGINCSTNTQPLIEDCILEQNSGTSTNGINLSSAAALIRNCIIRNNGGFNANGGGINANNSPNTIIQNCLIVGNQGRIAGAIYSSFDSPQIINCTIIQNQGAEKAGGVYATRLLNMRNSIVWNNTSPEGLPSIFAETYWVTYCNLENKWPDLGNLNEEPIFLDTLFHLDPSSSDVDAGNPFDAFDLEPSPNGERINMGWFGNTSEAALGIDGEPIIDSLAIGVSPIQGGITDTITGKKFGTNVGTLTVGGQPATIQSWSDTQIICTIPAHPAGKVGVKITTADAKMETLTYGFTYEGSLSIKVPVDYPTIQEALNVAINGDTVLVAPGTYSGPGNFNLNFQGKAILLASEAGAEQTIIDVTGADFGSSYGIRFTSQETRETIVRGFTITGAERAGINCSTNTQPLIEDCILEQNSGTSTNGINLSSAAALIRNCIIRNNGGFNANGGGINANNSPNTIIQNCLIVGNQGRRAGAIYSSFDSPQIINCSITKNLGEENAGGIYCTGILHMRNSIVWDNTSIEGEASISADSSEVSYSDIKNGWDGTGNINANPIFLNPNQDDFHLFPSSPCIDSGDPTDDFSKEPAPNGNRINMGFYGNTLEAASFSAITKIIGIEIMPNCEAKTQIHLEGVLFGENQDQGFITIGVDTIVNEDIISWTNESIVFNAPTDIIGDQDILINSMVYGRDSIPAEEIISPNFTYISGPVSGTWTNECPSTYILTGDVEVLEGTSLTIEAGVTILAAPDSSLNPIRFEVEGNLDVLGTASDGVLFSVLPTFKEPGRWQGLIFASSSAVQIEYATIEYAINGIEAHSSANAIQHCKLQLNEVSGIIWRAFSDEQASGRLEHSFIQNNLGWGVICDASCGRASSSANPLILGNTISENLNGGIYVEGVAGSPPPFVFVPASQSANASPNITRNLIHNNEGSAIECYALGNWIPGSIGSFRFRGFSSPIVHSNIIVDNNATIKASAPFFDIENSSWLSFSEPKFSSNTFWVNKTGTLTLLASDSAKVYIDNSILWGANDPIFNTETGGEIVVSFSNLPIIVEGTGNISEDPLFLDPVNGDFNLAINSPCIDEGSNDLIEAGFDFFDNNRVQDGNGDGIPIIDMGAIERDQITQLKEYSLFNEVSIFPNPTTDIVSIEWPIPQSATYILYDYTGKYYKSGVLNSESITKINLESYSSSVYLLKIINHNGKFQYYKIIKSS